jgi:cyclin-dependent kinase 12/13
MAKTSHRSGSDGDQDRRQQFLAPDDGEPPAGVTVNRSPASRSPAFMTDFEAAAAALRGSEELPSKQYVLVDHV